MPVVDEGLLIDAANPHFANIEGVCALQFALELAVALRLALGLLKGGKLAS